MDIIVELEPPAAAAAGSVAGEQRASRRAVVAQAAFLRRVRAAVPAAEVRWRYRLVLDGVALRIPANRVADVAGLPGVVRVYPSLRYRSLGRPGGRPTPRLPAGVAPLLGDAGRGIKIGIIDDGIDQRHPFFDPAGFTAPDGFPKGDRAFTTAKVIVARAFPPDGADYRYAARPFDPVRSFHGTHVAGIAAGDAGTSVPNHPDLTASGVAPLAYLGNYKALTVPTAGGVGLNGNSPELVAAIEAAVADGMDVINLSLGEPQVTPEYDAVARALDAAAQAGVIPVVAAGNEFDVLGRGSVGSPGTAERAITVGALDATEIPLMAPFSSSGPTPLGLASKPDVSAPGVDVLSAAPGGGFVTLSGTSMATPHVAGIAAILRNLHPSWTVEQTKSALVLTGDAVFRTEARTAEAASVRQGGGAVDVRAAASPAIFASPQSLSFGLLDVSAGSATATRSLELDAEAGGAGSWQVEIVDQRASAGVSVTAAPVTQVPGSLEIAAAAAADAPEGEHTGFVVLSRGGIHRRVPYWFRVTRPKLPGLPAIDLPGPGTFRGDTRGGTGSVLSYRYPDPPASTAGPLRGRERVFRIVLDRPAANLGAAIVSAGPGVRIEPRIVAGADENRLMGTTALTYVTNPYLWSFGFPVRSSAALFPGPGTYSIVIDAEAPQTGGRFTLRVWVDDVTPPSVRLLGHVARDGRLRARVADRGSGVDPDSVVFRIAGLERHGAVRAGVATLDLAGIRPGVYRLRLQVADRQERKNTENVPGILPNTRFVDATVRIPSRAATLSGAGGRRAPR